MASHKRRRYMFGDSSLENMGEASNKESRGEEMMQGEVMKIISDPIHDIIKIHPLCLKIIDTPEFQRLRDLTQCGVSSLVYPAATHSRFEHSLGVYFLVGEAFDSIISDKKIHVDDKDKLCLQIAGLCHDLGHGPFSHSWQDFIYLATNKKWRHEDNSVIIFKHMIVKNDLKRHFKKYKIANEIDFIAHLIQGDCNKKYNDKKFIFQIVANNKTKIDVDKWDYMLRDAFYFNIPRKVDYKRILSGMFVDEHNDLAFRDKVADDIKEIFDIRKIFHKKCYQHRVTKTIEVMLMDVLLLADKQFFNYFYKEYKDMTLSKAYKNPELFSKLTNYIYYLIQHSIFDGLSEARNLIERIVRRKLYTLIGECEKNTKLTDDNLSELMKELENNFHGYHFRKTIISASSGKENDVLKEVKFYNKDKESVYFEGKIDSYSRILIFCTSHKNDIDDDTMKEMKSDCKTFLDKYTIRLL